MPYPLFVCIASPFLPAIDRAGLYLTKKPTIESGGGCIGVNSAAQPAGFSLFWRRFAASAANLQQTPAETVAPQGLSGGEQQNLQQKTGNAPPAIAPA
jgi:hypothetical protein